MPHKPFWPSWELQGGAQPRVPLSHLASWRTPGLPRWAHTWEDAHGRQEDDKKLTETKSAALNECPKHQWTGQDAGTWLIPVWCEKQLNPTSHDRSPSWPWLQFHTDQAAPAALNTRPDSPIFSLFTVCIFLILQGWLGSFQALVKPPEGQQHLQSCRGFKG